MITRTIAVVTLAALLSGCGVPDLVAHTVKAVEKNQQDKGQTAAAPQSQAPQARPAADEAPPPVAPPQARRSTVTVEELPPR